MTFGIITCVLLFIGLLVGGIPVDRARERAAAEDAERDAKKSTSAVTSQPLGSENG